MDRQSRETFQKLHRNMMLLYHQSQIDPNKVKQIYYYGVAKGISETLKEFKFPMSDIQPLCVKSDVQCVQAEFT